MSNSKPKNNIGVFIYYTLFFKAFGEKKTQKNKNMGRLSK